MRMLGACLFLIGGLLWAGEPIYDWLVLNREINTGYPPSDAMDYLSFVIPLLCLGGILSMLSYYGKKIVISSAILSLSLILISTFHFFESYFYGSNVPAGLIFLFPGFLFLLIGACILVIQIFRQKVHKIFFKAAVGLCAVTFTFCLSPFFTQQLDNKTATFIAVLLMVLIGFIWTSFGVILYRLRGSRA